MQLRYLKSVYKGQAVVKETFSRALASFIRPLCCKKPTFIRGGWHVHKLAYVNQRGRRFREREGKMARARIHAGSVHAPGLFQSKHPLVSQSIRVYSQFRLWRRLRSDRIEIILICSIKISFSLPNKTGITIQWLKFLSLFHKIRKPNLAWNQHGMF